MILWTCLLLISTLSIAAFALAAGEGSAEGTWIMNGSPSDLNHAYAFRLPAEAGGKGNRARIIVTERPVPPEALLSTDDMTPLLMEFRLKGIQIEVTQGSRVASWGVLLPGFHTLEPVRSASAFQATAWDNDHIEGVAKAGPQEIGGSTISIAIKFKAKFLDLEVETPPTPADAAAAKKSEAAQAYLAFLKALAAADRDALRRLVTTERAGLLDTPQAAEFLKQMQRSAPQQVRILKAKEQGDRTTLWVSGRIQGEAVAGKITMVKQDGRWVLQENVWKL